MKRLKILLVIFLFCGPLLAQDTAKVKEFKPSGKVWGYAFGDYFFKMHADSLNRGSQQYSAVPVNSSSFEFRRVYLGYDYNISEKFSTECLLSYEGQTLSDAATRTVFVKAANVRWKNVLPNQDIIFGLVNTPGFAFQTEKVWGYRSVEKTILDSRKLSGSTDLGISIHGKYNDKGDMGYYVMLANGSGTKIETDQFKKAYLEFYVKPFKQKMLLDLYYDYERTNLALNYHKDKTTYKICLAYMSDVINGGVEIVGQTHTMNAIATDTAGGNNKTDTVATMAFGYSVFLRARIIKDKLNAFVRYDSFDPDMNFNNELVYSSAYKLQNTEMFLTAGIDFTPNKNIHIIPNIWYNAYNSRKKDVKGLWASDNDMVIRCTIHYIFK